MAQQRALPQSKETLLQSYNKRLKDDIKSIMDNFTEIIKTAKVGGADLSPLIESVDSVSPGIGLLWSRVSPECPGPGGRGSAAVSTWARPSSQWGEHWWGSSRETDDDKQVGR